MEDRILIATENIFKSFGDLEVLNGLSFNVKEGEFVSIFGPSGCGKSTLFKILSYLDIPDKGTIRIAGLSPTENLSRFRSHLSMVWQESRLIPWKTALQNVLFAMELRYPERKKSDMIKPAREALEFVGLAGFGDNLPIELSGGMKQRVNLARALCLDTPVILMDEPLANLNEITEKRALMNEILKLWEAKRKVILYITHSVNEAVALSDRILVCSEKPTKILGSVDVYIPRPRDLTSQGAMDIRSQIISFFDKGLVE